MMEKIETTILRNLLFNGEYCRKVLPFIKPEYFDNLHEKVVFEELSKFIVSYEDLATKEVLLIEAEKRTDLNGEVYTTICEYVSDLDDSHVDSQWLMDNTEKWCRDRAIYLALMESINIADGQDPKKGRDSIPGILQEALSVSFDEHIGHDLIDDYERRYEYYTRVEEKLPFDLDYFNRITNGGLSKKTLSLILAGPNVGKSLAMCSFASGILSQGKNVLYLTMEMSEEKIAQRIDANLLNVNISDIKNLPKETFENKIIKLAKKTQGKLIIKEYAPMSAHVGHFKALLNELSLKKHFHPDIIFVDYLNICASSRYRNNSGVNSYTYVKSVSEELRALSVEYNVPIFSSTQTTRSGYSTSDPEMTDTSESFGTVATVDMIIAMIKTEELDQLGQVMFKQIKNRDNDVSKHKRFVVGIDRNKMRLYDVEQNAQVEALDVSLEEEYTYEDTKSKKEKFSKFKY
jgi:archaellum biogenesis ATPase FlaH